MCGIGGIVGFNDPSLLQKMSQRLAHRGPDDKGFYRDGKVSLFHRRLSIIDLTSGGHQPFLSEDKKTILVANGEIYNYLQLKKLLEEKGHQFKGQSDNEVILHGFQEWGFGLFRRLLGIFAFAIWDGQRKQLILARDHLGVKPLYYSCLNGKIVFASEAKAIFAWKEIRKEVDPEALDLYFSLRYIPGEKTIFAQIKKLSPGSFGVFKNGKFSIRRFWRLDFRKERVSFSKAAKQIRNLLEESVSSQLMSQVPLGTYLSGGLDSSVVTAMAKKKKKQICTFSLGFHAPIDESQRAQKLAKVLKTRHRQFYVKKEDLLKLPEIVRFLDEPIGDLIILPIYLLAKEARKRVKVVLTGDGADEIFSGYIHHLGIWTKKRLTKIFPKTFLVIIAKMIPNKLVDHFFPYPASIGSKGKHRLIQFLEAKTIEDEFLSIACLFSEEEKESLYSSKFKVFLGKKKTINKEIGREFGQISGDSFSRLIGRDLAYWLPDYILNMADRLSMASGLEARVPYLDRCLVQKAVSLPADFKIRGKRTKCLLRQAAKGLLPQSIITSPKQAFFFPLEMYAGKHLNWLFEKTLNQKLVEKRGLFNFEYIQKLKNNFGKNPLLVGKQLFSLVILELWLQKYADFKI